MNASCYAALLLKNPFKVKGEPSCPPTPMNWREFSPLALSHQLSLSVILSLCIPRLCCSMSQYDPLGTSPTTHTHTYTQQYTHTKSNGLFISFDIGLRQTHTAALPVSRDDIIYFLPSVGTYTWGHSVNCCTFFLMHQICHTIYVRLLRLYPHALSQQEVV